MITKLKSEKDTSNLAKQISKHLKSGDLICLYGQLGTGKTTFTRYLIQHLTNPQIKVPSPTFTLLQTYETTKGITIYHYDFYRLKSVEETFELDIDEALTKGITIIEWPEIAESILPKTSKNRLNIHFSLQQNSHLAKIKPS